MDENLRRLAILTHDKYDFEKERAEKIADNLPAEYFNNFCQKTKTKEEFWELFKKYVTPKREEQEFKKDSHYRLPLTLVNNFTWAELSDCAKALLPVIGCYKVCYLARETMAKYIGYSVTNMWDNIDKALKELVKKNLIYIKESYPTHEYSLADKALHEKGRSYFPIYWYQIEDGEWAKLTRSERTFYVVAGMKGTINHSLVDKEEGHHCAIDLSKIKRFREWAGLTDFSYHTAKKSLSEKEILLQHKKGGRFYILKKLKRKYFPKEGKLLRLVLDTSNGN